MYLGRGFGADKDESTSDGAGVARICSLMASCQIEIATTGFKRDGDDRVMMVRVEAMRAKGKRDRDPYQ